MLEPWKIIANDNGTPIEAGFNFYNYPEMTDDVIARVFEQLYGMIWWMAYKAGVNDRQTALSAINNARENAQTGVDIGTGAWVQPFTFYTVPVVSFDQTDEPASPECPIYKKVRASPHSNFWMITCDEGWRTLIVCTDLYENVADWLLNILGRTPYAKKKM